MRWQFFLQHMLDQRATMGALLVARRAADIVQPIRDRIWNAVITIVPQALIAGFAGLAGAWVALDSRLDAIEKNQIEVKSFVTNRAELREQQVKELQANCLTTQSRLAADEGHLADLERRLTKFEALEEARHGAKR